MAEENSKYFGTKNLNKLWDQIKHLLDRKLESVTNYDNSVKVTNKRMISVRISETEGNALKANNFPGEEGLFVSDKPKSLQHKLTFGADEEYIFDGSEDITVPVYKGDVEDQ